MENILIVMPAIPTRGIAVFPGVKTNIDVGREAARNAVNEAMQADNRIFLVMQMDETVDVPSTQDCMKVGVIARILRSVNVGSDIIRISVEGMERAPLNELQMRDNIFRACIGAPFTASEPQQPEAEAYRDIIQKEGEALAASRGIAIDLPAIFSGNLTDRAVDITADVLLTEPADIAPVMEQADTLERLRLLCEYILRQNQIAKLERDIALRVKEQMDNAQKEYYLREQIKAIQKELGDSDSQENDKLKERIEASDMPGEVREKALKEFSRMTKMAPGMPEISLIRNYLDWLLELPWTTESKECCDLKNARAILDRDHYGMEKVKKRVLEYLAVRERTGNSEGTILCLVGPPGVGKTSIAVSLAEAMGKKYVRMSLGGVRDEAEIRGHRRTYVGAIPGRIIYTMKQAGTVNPLFLLDEIDKMSSDFKGDPASAMLEVLDREQNNAFRDHYIEVPYDLSKVTFVTTANTLDTIPQPLKDRMEIIELGSYTNIEKFHIAKEHLLPKQLKKHGLNPDDVKISDAVLMEIVNDYTREAGVRNLERRLADVCRYCVCSAEKGNSVRVTSRMLSDILQGHHFVRDETATEDKIGVATGLAWTAVGGETLSIETAVMSGSGELVLTGSLGDVMKESATAALSIIRSHAQKLGISEEFYKTKDIHVHVPEGATPKDGPSAGVSILSSMVSALCNTTVRGDTAMTGEITLSGRVLPIGGLKEKSIAAYRAGVKRVIIPEGNREDIKEIPKEVAGKLEFIPVKNVTQLLSNSLRRDVYGGN